MLEPVAFIGEKGYCLDERGARAIQINLEKVHGYADKCDKMVEEYNKEVSQ